MRSTFLVLLCFAAGVGCGRSDPIVFGHLDPKGKDDSEYRALRLAAEGTNDDPAKRPFERRVHVVHADAGQTLDQLQSQAVRLATVNRAFALLGGDTALQAERLGQVAQADSVLAVTPSGWSGSPPNQFLFPVGIAASEQARCLAQFAVDTLHVQRVAVLTDKALPFHRAVAEALERKLDKAVVVSVALPRPAEGTRERNLQAEKEERTALAQRLHRANPDALLLAMAAQDALEWFALLSQAAADKTKPPLVLFGGEESELPLLHERAEATVGWIATTAIAPDENAESYRQFADAYRKTYEREPDAAGALIFDAFQVLVQGCKRASDATTTKVGEELRKKDASFDVLTGKLTFARDQTARRPVYVVRFEKDGLKRVQRYEPPAEAPEAK